MNKLIKLILCVALTLSIGAVSGIATSSSVNSWYMTLNKPSFNPPNNIFGPVWTLLYVLMGISFYLIVSEPKSEIRTKGISVFMVQLFLNFLWSFLFFKWQLLGVAFIEIIMIWGSILSMIVIFYRINKTAALLQIPYLLWVSFASILNGYIWWLN